MKPSKFKQEKIKKEKSRAVILYKQGLGLRQVGGVLNKSHEWVRQAVREELGDKY